MRRIAIFLLFAGALAAAGCGSGSGSSGTPQPGATAVIQAGATSGVPPLTITFDGGASFSDEGIITSWWWDFGDGTETTGAVVEHTFTVTGSYTVRLVVTDSVNATDETFVGVSVGQSSGAPVAVISASVYAGLRPLAVTFNASGSSDPGGAVVSYHWNFGNGNSANTVTAAQTFAAGVYQVTLTVTDNDGHTGQAQTVIAVASWDEEVVRLTNVERYSNGLLPPVRKQSNLDAAALRHSTDMAVNMVDHISHTGTDGSSMVDRVEDAGYTPWTRLAENVAAGYSSPAAVLDGWMNSSGHRANILNADLRELGASYVYTSSPPYYHFWTQNFGTRANVYPVVINREAHATSSRSVSLYLHGSGWAQEMMLSSAADFAGAVWEPFAATRAWTLPSGLGIKTVYAKLRSGPTERTASDTIVLVAQ